MIQVSNPSKEKGFFSFSKRPDWLWSPVQSPVHGYQGPFLGVKRSWLTLNTHSTEEWVEIYHHSPIRFLGVDRNNYFCNFYTQMFAAFGKKRCKIVTTDLSEKRVAIKYLLAFPCLFVRLLTCNTWRTDFRVIYYWGV